MKQKIILLALTIVAIATFTLCTKSADIEPIGVENQNNFEANNSIISGSNNELDKVLKHGIKSQDDFQVLVDSKVEPFNKIDPALLKDYKNDLLFRANNYVGSKGETYKKIAESLSEKDLFLFLSLLAHDNIIIKPIDGELKFGPVFFHPNTNEAAMLHNGSGVFQYRINQEGKFELAPDGESGRRICEGPGGNCTDPTKINIKVKVVNDIVSLD